MKYGKLYHIRRTSLVAMELYIKDNNITPSNLSEFIEMLIARTVPGHFYQEAKKVIKERKKKKIVKLDERQTSIPGINPGALSSITIEYSESARPLRVGPVQPNAPDFCPVPEKDKQ